MKLFVEVLFFTANDGLYYVFFPMRMCVFIYIYIYYIYTYVYNVRESVEAFVALDENDTLTDKTRFLLNVSQTKSVKTPKKVETMPATPRPRD